MDDTNEEIWTLCEGLLLESRPSQGYTKAFVLGEVKVERTNEPYETRDVYRRPMTVYRDILSVYDDSGNKIGYVWTQHPGGDALAAKLNEKYAGKTIRMEIAFAGRYSLRLHKDKIIVVPPQQQAPQPAPPPPAPPQPAGPRIVKKGRRKFVVDDRQMTLF
jgi:hypothetical protein